MAEFDRVEVGRKVRRLRNAQQLTVHELARRSGVSAGYLSEVERGIPAVSVDKLAQIAEGIGLSLENLLDESKESDATNVVSIPVALSVAAEKLNLSHRATLTLLQGQRSLTARRSKSEAREWSVEDWMRFYEQVKDYLPASQERS
ncbi:MAG: helix-turn-helix domain-containing protein [Gemmataceae bacterium]